MKDRHPLQLYLNQEKWFHLQQATMQRAFIKDLMETLFDKLYETAQKHQITNHYDISNAEKLTAIVQGVRFPEPDRD